MKRGNIKQECMNLAYEEPEGIRTGSRCLIFFIVIYLICCLGSCRKIYAAEKDMGRLEVDITNGKGEQVLIRDGATYYTASLVKLTPKQIENGKYSYTISKDNGKSFGEYIPMDDGVLTIYPKENVMTDNYTVKIKCERSVTIETGDDEEDDTGDEDGSGDDDNTGNEKGKGENGENAAKEELTDEELSMQLIEDVERMKDMSLMNEAAVTHTKKVTQGESQKTVSEVWISREFRIQFDLGAPDITVQNPQVLNGWINTESNLSLKCTDNGSRISRIVAKDEEGIVFERHFGTDESSGQCNIDIPLRRKAVDSLGQSVDLLVSDNAGNEMRTKYTYFLDNESPNIYVAGIDSGQVLSEDGSGIIGIMDNCPFATYIHYIMRREMDGYEVTDEVSVCGGDSPENTTQLYVNQEGKYHLIAWAEDLAGNRSGDIDMSFVVDKTAPVIAIEGISDGVDSKVAPEVTINVNEGIYENCNVSVTVIRRRQNESATLPISSFVMNSPCESRTINIRNDGDYDVYVSAVDAAGHTSSAQTHFRVDKSAPDLNISGISEGEVTSEKPVIRISAADIFYDATIIDSTLYKKNNSGNFTQINNEKYVMKDTQDSLDINVGEEGVYMLKCSATDRSGNSSSKETYFTVDYTPPVITGMESVNGKYLTSFKMPGQVSGLIRDMTVFSYDAFMNEERIQENDEIIEEGKYFLRLCATDEANNYSQEEASFIIDRTSPQIVISGVSGDGIINSGSNVRVSLSESEDELTEVIFNGRTIPIEDNEASIRVDEYGDYNIKIKARDNAGNVTDKQIMASCQTPQLSLLNYVNNEKSMVANIVNNDKNDINFGRVLIGVITVLSGSMGLVLRGLATD